MHRVTACHVIDAYGRDAHYSPVNIVVVRLRVNVILDHGEGDKVVAAALST